MKRLGFSFLVLVLSVSTESFPVPAQRLVDHPFPSAGDAEVKQAGNEMAPAPPPLCSKIPPQRLYCKIHSHTSGVQCRHGSLGLCGDMICSSAVFLSTE